MNRRVLAGIAGAIALGCTAAPAQAATASAAEVRLGEYRIAPSAMQQLRDRWYTQLERRYGRGSWAPMKMAFHRGGRAEQLEPGLVSFAGTGYFGIRPGAWLLLISGGSIGWCSAAHVYGSPGSYSISTAGHCGKAGDRATVIGAIGNNTPVLIDFGAFKSSRDGGLGADQAIISIDAPWQSLVTPTMAFWGGPRGVFTKSGSVAGYTLPNRGIVPQVSVNPDPFLAQQIVHYGHGTGVGAGGTPRSGTAIAWGSTHFMFFGAISPGDSGSGSNTLGGDTVGAVNEAAGINTHLYVDPLMRKGLGLMGGTRTTAVGTPANGQLVGYPAPAPILP
jgi:hypothetical protein